MKRSLRPIARGMALVGVLLAVLAVRVVSSSHSELRRGEQLLSRGDPDAAILAFRRAARSYAPANPYSTQALERLWAIGSEAEGAGESERALAAFRSIRGAILGARSFYVPHREQLARADERIASLMAAASASRGGARPPAAAVLEQLRRPLRPQLGFTLLLLAGWIGWVGGAFAFAQRALDEEDRLRPRAARLWGTVVVLGFGCFVIGMSLA